MVRISVAMATYNGAKYLQEQLDSIRKQRCAPYELVVTDDGSTDDTVAIVETFAVEAPFPVRVFRGKTHLNFANNFLKCASLCVGDWIAFCDQDDSWYDNKLQRMAEVIDQHCHDDIVMLCHSADLVDQNLKKVGRRLPNFARDELKPMNSHFGFWCVGGCVMAFNAKLIRQIDPSLRPRDHFLPYSPKTDKYPWLPHDKWICMLANACGNTAYVSELLGMYRRHENAYTGSYENPTFVVRYRKAVRTGGDFYRFQADVARETADLLRMISSALEDRKMRTRLLASSRKFDAFADIHRERANLYLTASVGGRARVFWKMIRKRGYFGDPFFSLGTRSLAKDLCTTIGLIDKLSCIGKCD